MAMNRKLNILIQDFQILSKGNVNFDKLSMYISTFHSTSIEGSTLTENQVIDLLSYNKTSNKPMEHHLMVLDHYEAMKYCIGEAEKKKRITVEFIKKLASLVSKNTGSVVKTALGEYDISKGDIRLSGVFAGRRQFPDAKKVPELLKTLVDSINKDLVTCKTTDDQIKLAFRTHFDFVSIHPFGDGNGRVSRLLMNYVLTYFDLPMTIVFKQDRVKYIQSLENARNKEDQSVFYTFMFSQYEKYLKQEIKLLTSF